MEQSNRIIEGLTMLASIASFAVLVAIFLPSDKRKKTRKIINRIVK